MNRNDRYEYHRWQAEPLNLQWSDHRRKALKRDDYGPNPWLVGGLLGALVGIGIALLFV